MDLAGEHLLDLANRVRDVAFSWPGWTGDRARIVPQLEVLLDEALTGAFERFVSAPVTEELLDPAAARRRGLVLSIDRPNATWPAGVLSGTVAVDVAGTARAGELLDISDERALAADQHAVKYMSLT